MIDPVYERERRLARFDLLMRAAPAANQRWSLRKSLLGTSSITLPGWRE